MVSLSWYYCPRVVIKTVDITTTQVCIALRIRNGTLTNHETIIITLY